LKVADGTRMSHEKECAIRSVSWCMVSLTGLDKRMWRLEAMIMGSTDYGSGYGGYSIYGNELIWRCSKHLNLKQ
jgi:hypothetical protein